MVTGGGGGIGRAVALTFARVAPVAAVDLDERGLEVKGTELMEVPSDHVVRRCDTASPEALPPFPKPIETALGSCGVLVNTAAVLRPGGLERCHSPNGTRCCRSI